MNNLSRHSLLADSQLALRKNRNTILQLLTVVEDWIEALDNKLQVDTVFLDFNKAFDSVRHKRLVTKLKGYDLKW